MEQRSILSDSQYHFTCLVQSGCVELGCEFRFVDQIGYANAFNMESEHLFSQIGINCHLCPRQACSQRAHQPLFIELPISPDRRGNTRYES